MAGKKYAIIAAIDTPIDSKRLHTAIKQYGMNVLDAGWRVYIYNFRDVPSSCIVKALQKCCDYGECKVLSLTPAK